MLVWLLENAVAAAVLAVLVAAVCRLNRSRPALCHFLWLLVLVRLVAPPVPAISISIAPLRERVAEAAARAWHRLAPEGAASSHSELPRSVSSRDVGAGLARAPEPEDVRKPSEYGESSATSSGGHLIVFPEGGKEAGGGAAARLGVIALWAIGALVMLSREARRAIRLDRVVRRSPAAPRDLKRLVRRVGSRLGVKAPAIRLVPGLDSPFVWALSSPVLAWPSDGGGIAKEPRCRGGLVAHELAHLRRRDHWTAWLESAAILLHWWNPLLWLVRRRLRFHAEVACDAWAVKAYPAERRFYAEALIDAAERMSRWPSPAPALGAVDSTRRDFEERLRVIFSRDSGRNSRRVLPSLAATVLAALTLLSWAGAGRAGASGPWSRIDPALVGAIRAEIARVRAERHLEASETGEAAALASERLKIAPGDGRAWSCLGRSLLESGRSEEAVRAFERQIALGFEPGKGEFDLGIALAELGRAADAIGAIERAAGRGFGDAKVLRTDARLAAIRADEALDARLASAMARIAEPAETSPPPYEATETIARAAELLAAGDVDRALDTYRCAVLAGTAVPCGLFGMSACLARLGEKDAALAYLGLAVEAGFTDSGRIFTEKSLDSLRGDPRLDAVVYETSAASTLVRYKATSWERLEKRCEERLRAKPDDGLALDQLGMCALKTGRHDLAIDAFRRQYEAGYSKETAAYNAACSHARKRETDAAIDWLEKAIGAGFKKRALLCADPDLDSLRSSPRFAALLARL